VWPNEYHFVILRRHGVNFLIEIENFIVAFIGHATLLTARIPTDIINQWTSKLDQFEMSEHQFLSRNYKLQKVDEEKYKNTYSNFTIFCINCTFENFNL